MSPSIFRCYIEAGQIAADAIKYAEKTVDVGSRAIDICENVETFIIKRGGGLAFPCNVCINQVSAHYTSPPNDDTIIPPGAVVKVDLGVHVDGYIADTATTISFDPEYSMALDTARDALEKATKALRPKVKASQIGSLIEKTIKSRGFKPIWNLAGHQLSRYVIHAGKSIPNVSSLDGAKIDLDEVYAIEPFVVPKDAAGSVKNLDKSCIFRFQKKRKVKNPQAENLLDYIIDNFKTLPFAERWILKQYSQKELGQLFQELLDSKSILDYPVLVEASGAKVVQFEHTVLVGEEKNIVSTQQRI
jgi:methionyl aminopeptidase